MMTLLATGLKALLGPYLTKLTIPAMIVGLVVLGHQLVRAHDSRVRAEATNVCDKAWESDIRRQERDVAQQSVVAARAILVGEREVNEGLKHELDKVQQEIEAVRAASSGSDARCLSDSMLRAIGGNEQGGGSQARPSKITPAK